MSELYIIDRTPQTDLEKYLSARVEALMNRNEYLEQKLIEAKEILNSIVIEANEIEVIEPEILNR